MLYSGSGSECGGNGVYSGCPVDNNLIVAATQWRTNHNPSSPAPLCRCPVNWSAQAIVRDDSLLPAGYQGNHSWAAVQVQLSFPPSSSETMVVIFALQSNGTWLANDTYCDNPQNRLGAPGATSCIH